MEMVGCGCSGDGVGGCTMIRRRGGVRRSDDEMEMLGRPPGPRPISPPHPHSRIPSTRDKMSASPRRSPHGFRHDASSPGEDGTSTLKDGPSIQEVPGRSPKGSSRPDDHLPKKWAMAAFYLRGNVHPTLTKFHICGCFPPSQSTTQEDETSPGQDK